MARFPHRRILRRQPETSAVAEQEQYTFGNTRELLAHHKERAKMMDRTLGELPEDQFRERALGKKIFDPGAGFVSDWINRFTQSNFPFNIGIVSERAIPANPLRCYLLIQNKSANIVFVNFGQNATAFNGIRIIAGGNYELIGGATGGAFCPADDVYILADAAATEGVVTEGVIMSITPEGY
jgi:hypothetical protein